MNKGYYPNIALIAYGAMITTHLYAFSRIFRKYFGCIYSNCHQA